MKPSPAFAWRAALTVVSGAAIATTGWSLYEVARHYETPKGIAVAAVAVFDGAAYACLRLASEASAAGRSAAGARLATVAMAAVSVYLNRFHADLIGGGTAAALLFAVPTLALLVVSELAWAGPRAAARAARGEQPYRLPAFGAWAWLLAPYTAGVAVRERALAHIETGGQRPAAPPAPRTASAALRDHFAGMDPADAIHIAHDAQPDMPPAELAALLRTYGVNVDTVQVALVLGGGPAEVTVDRAPADDADDAPHDAPQVGALPPVTKAQAIIDAAAHLGAGASAPDIVRRVERVNRIVTDDRYVRTVLSRDRKARGAGNEGIGQGGGGYA
ncbi:DUF2637 domain-containing protein [Streptomyces sp. AC563]|uniref:DUF2637 domain-containing protein n=1 Tax=Streptomyces buecherae TaxID=2763006 RepID=UPI00164E6DAF|nr:DUF2637 domain-containing protein [Streptomyces buecherae]MBC3988039.1 DUF2637 domain-containing protein [Streptomyces buecherae]